jgi:hypothetical protein
MDVCVWLHAPLSIMVYPHASIYVTLPYLVLYRIVLGPEPDGGDGHHRVQSVRPGRSHKHVARYQGTESQHDHAL